MGISEEVSERKYDRIKDGDTYTKSKRNSGGLR